MRAKLAWHQWHPGLDNAALTLGEVLNTLPAAAAVDIPWQVRLLENPASPLALPGAISLARHDAIHVLLGRGLSSQDEAFVIGFTMGATRAVRPWQRALFRWAVRHFYPRPYNFRSQDLTAFDLGFDAGAAGRARDLHLQPLEMMGDVQLGRLRQHLGIDVNRLHAIYSTEQLLLPDTRPSRRLPRLCGGPNPSLLLPP